MRTKHGSILVALIGGCIAAGCEKRTSIDEPDARRLVELLMPQRIEIVEAFTAFKSFGDTDRIDGIELLLQATDSFGDPVKIAGTVRVELYTFEQASGNRAGARLCPPWEMELVSHQDQKKHWNMVTGMYELPLQFPDDLVMSDVAAGAPKCVIQVTYNTPLEEHLVDECVLQVPSSRQ